MSNRNYLMEAADRAIGVSRSSKITPRRMVRLQAKLNSIFVRKRDAGEPIWPIYNQLQIVERWLGRRRIFW